MSDERCTYPLMIRVLDNIYIYIVQLLSYYFYNHSSIPTHGEVVLLLNSPAIGNFSRLYCASTCIFPCGKPIGIPRQVSGHPEIDRDAGRLTQSS